uniref:Ground-like domain-containing protein n=1 Tax=Syphacia muris TaxID=451379 RepID=A0A158R5D5_9BILA
IISIRFHSATVIVLDGNDLLGVADNIQSKAEKKLGGKFETVVALDDFAYKSHFKDGKTCKIEKDGRYALAWQP